MQWVSDRDVSRMREVPHFGNSHYADFDVNKLFGFYVIFFVNQLEKFCCADNIRKIADIGTGYGWLAIAFALHTKLDVVAVDFNEERILAARRLANILRVEDRIDWVVASVDRLPFGNREIDATYCVEVIEHVGDTPAIVRDLARVTDNLLTITTPNKLFPVIHHDTGLPMCHWLPPGRLRDVYAKTFGRASQQDNNRFWSSTKLLSSLPEFQRISTILQFPSLEDYRTAYQQFDPNYERYGHFWDGLQNLYFRAAALAGCRAVHLMPNLASTFRRQMSDAPS